MSAPQMKQRYRRKNSDDLATALDIKTFPEPMSGCYLWHGATNAQGYPRIRWRGKVLLAHRAAYEVHYGVAPGPLLVCHKCDNPSCVNPSHLFLGTPLDNNRDRSRKGRSARLIGENHPGVVLTDAQVISIRAEYRRGSHEHSTTALARRYGVAQGTIWMIVNGRLRKHPKAAA